jgi:hypothetical protein
MARTSATRCTAAHGAGLLSSVGKVLAVLLAMATLHKKTPTYGAGAMKFTGKKSVRSDG